MKKATPAMKKSKKSKKKSKRESKSASKAERRSLSLPTDRMRDQGAE
jgi:hypothetical protein